MVSDSAKLSQGTIQVQSDNNRMKKIDWNANLICPKAGWKLISLHILAQA